jgi:D-amino-acid oxidase
MSLPCASHLTLGGELSLDSHRLKPASTFSPRVLVVGGDVIGLVTAWALLDRGYLVTIIATEWAPWTTSQRLTSHIAGALWELPTAFCGQHTDSLSLSEFHTFCDFGNFNIATFQD